MSILDDENILMGDVKSDIHPVNMLKGFIDYSVQYVHLFSQIGILLSIDHLV